MSSASKIEQTDMPSPVRISRSPEPSGAWRRWVFGMGLVVIGLGVLVALQAAKPDALNAGQDLGAVNSEPNTTKPARPSQISELKALPRGMRKVVSDPAAATAMPEAELPSHDPNDLATYLKPGDPLPTTGELIQALNDAGIHEGIAAFNPPGTSPPMAGLRVPEDFLLPPGYVRHHQVTDQGEPIDPILMFAPDFEFFDEHGNPVAIPENRVVPPELAPPGLPLETITIPDP